MIAQGLSGDELERQARHRVFPGNRPSTTLIYPRLSPFVLGQIIALYEHRVFADIELLLCGMSLHGAGSSLLVALKARLNGIILYPIRGNQDALEQLCERLYTSGYSTKELPMNSLHLLNS